MKSKKISLTSLEIKLLKLKRN